jgi:hypothetical protein
MANHIIVIFDHSGSMSEPFTQFATSQAPRGLSATHAIKIEEAKAQLSSWLETGDYDKATIVPFSSGADEPLTVNLPDEMAKARSFIYQFEANSNTNLVAALELVLNVRVSEPEDTYVRYLIKEKRVQANNTPNPRIRERKMQTRPLNTNFFQIPAFHPLGETGIDRKPA